MKKKMTRKEAHEEGIKIFLNSKLRYWPLHLYGREIRRLEEKFPIVITKKEKIGDMFDCVAYRKKSNIK